MKKGQLIIAAALALTVGAVVAPAAALAQRRNEGADGGRAPGSGRPAGSQQSFAHHHPFVARPFVRSFVRPFFPFVVVGAAPAFVYASPPAYYATPYYAPPVYYAPPASYDPPTTYYSPPPSGTVSIAPAPTQNVVQYPHGRYELRGDGVTVPYRWVWIPNPPPPPPAAPPPPAEPPAAPPADAPSSGAPPPARQSQLYRWTDTLGVVHWTDRLDAVPEQYRARAKQSLPS
ncbi:MAG: hypothetical protein DMD95_15290 [Candidatus Rokuibacteriota bacterium]|nr:MAG: hypothetical protein DMD95_15290 [Candidatus Rokubacteria bacterium]